MRLFIGEGCPALPEKENKTKAKLKNYTTTVPASQSIAEIQTILIEFGATGINIITADKQIAGITFLMEFNGSQIAFKLPVNIEKVKEYLFKEYELETTRGRKSRNDFTELAYNTTWRIMKDWIHAQVSIITTEQVQSGEVFLPYLIMGSGKTLAEQVAENGMKMLER